MSGLAIADCHSVCVVKCFFAVLVCSVCCVLLFKSAGGPWWCHPWGCLRAASSAIGVLSVHVQQASCVDVVWCGKGCHGWPLGRRQQGGCRAGVAPSRGAPPTALAAGVSGGLCRPASNSAS